jgi:galactokinase
MIEDFRKRYGTAEGVRVFRAPGRVNLIGEHTDYNLGFVMPVALSLNTYVASAPASHGKLRIFSEDRGESREYAVSEIPQLQPAHDWGDYPIGVAKQLVAAGVEIEPADLLIRSRVPEGSGLSSSAALEVSSALAFLNGRAFDKLQLARLCQRAERAFVGMPCGIMDQYISIFGRDQAAVEIDCRSLEHRDVILPTGITFVAVNTMVKHALAGSAYQDRVAECTAAVGIIRRENPQVESLRDVSPEMFARVESQLPKVVANRARHVVTEIHRVGEFVAASERGDLRGMGELMVKSHRSLQIDYEVSCAELDFLVDRALEIEGVFGARMTGGGFGGCIVAMVERGAVAGFRTEIAADYQHAYQLTPAIYECSPSAGAEEVKNFETIPPAAN